MLGIGSGRLRLVQFKMAQGARRGVLPLAIEVNVTRLLVTRHRERRFSNVKRGQARI